MNFYIFNFKACICFTILQTLRKKSYLSTYNILPYSKSTTGDSITGDF